MHRKLNSISNDLLTIGRSTLLRIFLTLCLLLTGTLALSSSVSSATHDDQQNDVAAIIPVAPKNALAAQNSVKIKVSDKGIQKVTGAALAVATRLVNPEVSKLALYFNGQPIPLDVQDNNNNGVLDIEDSFRFYAGEIGNYWDSHNIYWLHEGTADGPRMRTYEVSDSTAPNRSTAMEKGIWSDNRDYQSNIPGADGDHWFALDMVAEPSQVGNPEQYARLEANVGTTLPTASSGLSTFTLIGSAYTAAEYTLEIDMGTDAQEEIWDSRDNAPSGEKFQRNWEHTIRTTAKPDDIEIVLLPDDTSAGLVFDKIVWEQPVILNFFSRGGYFSGVSGAWNYNLSNIPNNHTIYMITDPMNPQRIPTESGVSASFVDNQINDYVVMGNRTLFEPEIRAHTPTTFRSDDGAQALYITPAEFRSEAARLANHRSSAAGGSFAAKVVNVQDIHDTWSYGHTDPEAIRSFLRFAVANWNPTPISVVLVGDGTRDPKDYTQKGVNNINHIPPYLRNIDPWIGETACERCYAQLHGDDPLNSTDDLDFRTDIQIGRLPAKNMTDTVTLVEKIIAYETATDTNARWRGVNIFLADNYVERVVDGRPFTNSAGDYAKFSDDIVKLQPRDIEVQRIYYDPYPHVGDPHGVEPWRQPDAAQARLDTIAAMNAGAGLVSYNGAANHWQWAHTDSNLPAPRLLNITDVNQLNNQDKYFIALSMTSYTSQFQKPAKSGTTLDERLIVRPNGGAVATWGGAGVSVAHIHDALQRGFHTALWSAEPMSARIGDLIEAGYDEVLNTGAVVVKIFGIPFCSWGIP